MSASSGITTTPPTTTTVEEAAALLGACITRLGNESAYRTSAPPLGLHTSFSTVKPVPCSELYQRLFALFTLLQQHSIDSSNNTSNNSSNSSSSAEGEYLQAAPSIIPLLHKLLHISSSLALMPIFLHSCSSTVPAQPLPQLILQNTLLTANNSNNNSNNNNDNSSVATSSTTSTTTTNTTNTNTNTNTPQNLSHSTPKKKTQSSNSNTNNSNSNSNTPGHSHNQQQKLQVPPIRITPPLSSQPIRHLWVQCITLAHRLSPPPSTTFTSNRTSTLSMSTNILSPYLSYAASHPRTAKSAGGTRVAAFQVLTHIISDDKLGKTRYFHFKNTHAKTLLQEIVTTCFNGLKSSGSQDVRHRMAAMKCIIATFTAYRDYNLIPKQNQQPQYSSTGGNNNESTTSYQYIQWNDMEEATLKETIKLIKKATDDKYPEVRILAAQLTAIVSTMFLLEQHQSIHATDLHNATIYAASDSNTGAGAGGSGSGGSSSTGAGNTGSTLANFASAATQSTSSNSSSSTSPLTSSYTLSNALSYLDEITLICFRNLDDEITNVGLYWSEALSRCMSSAIQYHEYYRLTLNQYVIRKGGTPIILPSLDPGNGGGTRAGAGGKEAYSNRSTMSFSSFSSSIYTNDLASKFKAYNETRKTLNSIASVSCISLEHSFTFLTSQFIRVGGLVSNKDWIDSSSKSKSGLGGNISGGGSGSGNGSGNTNSSSSGGSGNLNAESNISKLGGSYSHGKRFVRVGISNVIIHLCKLQFAIGGIYNGDGMVGLNIGSGSGASSGSGSGSGSGIAGKNASNGTLDPSHLITNILFHMIGQGFEQQLASLKKTSSTINNTMTTAITTTTTSSSSSTPNHKQKPTSPRTLSAMKQASLRHYSNQKMMDATSTSASSTSPKRNIVRNSERHSSSGGLGSSFFGGGGLNLGSGSGVGGGGSSSNHDHSSSITGSSGTTSGTGGGSAGNISASATASLATFKATPFANAGITRLIVSRIIRRGISECMTETMSLSLLRDLATLITTSINAKHNFNDKSSFNGNNWNGHQIQVALMEISHLVSTLSEASYSAIDDLIPALQLCLAEADHGVRYEASIAFQALIVVFPNVGRKFIMSAVDEIQVHHDEILAIGNKREPLLHVRSIDSSDSGSGGVAISAIGSQDSSPPSSSKRPPPKNRVRRFRRHTSSSKETSSATLSPSASSSALSPTSQSTFAAVEKSLEHQYALHGNSLVLSMILHVMPKLPGGLPSELLDIIIAVADNLISCQGNGVLLQNHPGASVTCVRAGYCIISGALTMGVKPTLTHMQSIFGIWAKSASFFGGEQRMEPMHDVSCLESFITSIVVFLRVSSELLLTVPDALNRTTQVLEKILPVIMGYSQLENDVTKPFMSSRLDSAKAAIMEAFAWLPPGSFPLIADSVFSFASRQIKTGTEGGMQCGLIENLVSSEDDVLDIRSCNRAHSPRQTGGGVTLGDSLMVLTSEYVNHSQRESVLHFVEDGSGIGTDAKKTNPIRELVYCEDTDHVLPTPLHEVGTWKEPPTPSRSSKQRLMDAAVHAFAATFGLQGGHQQTTAVSMLEELVIAARGSKLEHVTATNTAATLLSCLKALPLHEGSNGTVVGTGPPWMSRAARLFFELLRNRESLVRRVSAEGLSLLSSHGINENAHMLQSSILRSLEASMQGTVSENALQKQYFEQQSSRKAGCLLTLGCIQRTTSKQFHELCRQRSRFAGVKTSDTENAFSSSTTTLIMLTRVLPFTATHSLDEDSFLTRTYAIHTFHLLLAHSKLLNDENSSSDERKQILLKAIEILENNFFAAWKTNATEMDVRIYEVEKFAIEPSFLATLIRLMSYLLPRLHSLENEAVIANSFSSMVTIMVEISCYHPSVTLEGMAFYETLYSNDNFTSMDIFSPVSQVVDKIFSSKVIPQLRTYSQDSFDGCDGSLGCLKASLEFISVFTGAQNTAQKCQSKFRNHLFSLLESSIGSTQYARSPLLQTLTVPSSNDLVPYDAQELQMNIRSLIQSFLHIEKESSMLLNWLLLARVLMYGDLAFEYLTEEGADLDVETIVAKLNLNANSEAHQITKFSGNTVRWQIKHFASTIACSALTEIVKITKDEIGDEAFTFNLETIRKEIINKNLNETPESLITKSHVALHCKDLISIACSLTTVTLDQGELFSLQNAGLHFLRFLIEHFTDTKDPEDTSLDSNQLIMENLVSQVVPSVKHALSACDSPLDEESVATDGTRNFFINGCNALLLITEKGLVSDSSSLRRILRPLIPTTEEVSFCRYPESDGGCPLHLKPNSFVDNRMSVLLPRVGKIWCLGQMCIAGEMGKFSADVVPVILNEIKNVKDGVAILSAALAIDSFKLKVLKDSTAPSTNSDDVKSIDEHASLEMQSGITFANINDVDMEVQNEMIRNWASFGGFASFLITKLLNDEDESSTRFETLNVWLEKLVQVLFVAFHQSLELLQSAGAIEVSIIDEAVRSCTACLFAFNNIISSKNKLCSVLSDEALSTVLSSVMCTILSPWIDKNRALFESSGRDERLSYHMVCNVDDANMIVTQACQFVEQASNLKSGIETDLLIPLLQPFLSIEEETESLVDIDGSVKTSIVASYIRSLTKLTTHDLVDVGTVKSLFDLSVNKLMSVKSSNDTIVSLVDDVSKFIQCCINKQILTCGEMLHYIEKSARDGNWKTWELLCLSVHDCVSLTSSASFICAALDNLQDNEVHLGALSALCHVAKEHADWIPEVMGSFGKQIVTLFELHGTSNAIAIGGAIGEQSTSRMLACSNCMKIIMISFQFLVSRGTTTPIDEKPQFDNEIAAFLAVVFGKLASVVCYNGLPNQENTSNPNTDSALGRLCAQFFVHVLRACPSSFKLCLGNVNESLRGTLESSVRAEMSGYVVHQSVVPVKKKLNIKTFIKAS